MNFLFENISPAWIIGQIVIVDFIIILFLACIKIDSNHNIILIRRYISPRLIFLLDLLFCLFASFDGDYFSYYEIYKTLLNNDTIITNLEPIYVYIIDYFSFESYLLFRLIIWGSGLILCWLSFRRLQINNSIIWVIFTCTTLVNVAYLRVFLGMSWILYGVTLYISLGHKKLIKKFLSIIWICGAIFFHKSLIILIILSICSLLIKNRLQLLLSLGIFPILGVIAFSIITFLLLRDVNAKSIGVNYLEIQAVEHGIGFYLFMLMNYIIVFTTIGLLLLYYFRYNYYSPLNPLLILSVFILATYCLFIIIFKHNNMGGTYLCDRIFLMIYCCFPILFYRFFRESKYKKLSFSIFLLSIIACNYRLFYAWYLQNLGLGM